MNESWMFVAHEVSKKSKDPRTKVGAVIVDADDRVIATGRNGMVKQASEKGMWDNKYPFVIHAEMNAALFARQYLGGCTVYVTLSPCINCLKHLFQLGVRVVYYDKMYDRFTEQDKKDLTLMLSSLNCYVGNIKTKRSMKEELNEVV